MGRVIVHGLIIQTRPPNISSDCSRHEKGIPNNCVVEDIVVFDLTDEEQGALKPSANAGARAAPESGLIARESSLRQAILKVTAHH